MADVTAASFAELRASAEQKGELIGPLFNLLQRFNYREATGHSCALLNDALFSAGLESDPPISPGLSPEAEIRLRVARQHVIGEDGTKMCPECAEKVQGAARVCRFCGFRFDQRPGATLTSRAVPRDSPPLAATSGVAIAAFICSLLGFWIAGIPLGIHAQNQIDESEGRLGGRGFATAGIVLGILGIIATVILILALVAAAKHSSCTYTYSDGSCVG